MTLVIGMAAAAVQDFASCFAFHLAKYFAKYFAKHFAKLT
jgi:hypothetical protein